MYKKREDRRDRSWRYGARARLEHLRVAHQFDTTKIDCLCELSVWYFAKRKSMGCGCRSKKHGQPKLGVGMCKGLDSRPSYIERVEGNRLCRQWLAQAGQGDDCEL